MEEMIDLLSDFHENAPPFIRERGEEGYALVGNSDLANGEDYDYGNLGKCKLTAQNHTKTLLSLIGFIMLLDELSNKGLLDLDDIEVLAFIEKEFENVLNSFFGFEVKFDYKLSQLFINNNLQIVNEALYNITNDKEGVRKLDYDQQVDSLEGNQFIDPYINIAYEIAKEYKLRPYEVISEWSSSELVVAFAKIANDRSLDNFLNWKYSQSKAPKRKNPIKQAFYFEEINGDNDE